MTPVEVLYVLYHKRNEVLKQENDIRRICFYTVAPHSKLKRLSELWHIPEIDGDIDEMFAKARPLTDEERELYNEVIKRGSLDLRTWTSTISK